MEASEDVFGQMMWDCYNGKEVFETIERDDGVKNYLNPVTYFSSYENWLPIEQKALQFIQGKVLDVGCGAGRHSLYLQERGFEVLGIDVSPLAIKICKLRGLKQAKVMSIDKLDFKPNSFDSIILMGNNFGLLGSFGNGQKLLKQVYTITSKNALIIAGTRDPYKTDDPKHLAYHKNNTKNGRMAGQVKIRIGFQNHVSEWFDYLMASKEELEKILEGTGWKIKEIIDGKATNYIAIIKKIPE